MNTSALDRIASEHLREERALSAELGGVLKCLDAVRARRAASRTPRRAPLGASIAEYAYEDDHRRAVGRAAAVEEHALAESARGLEERHAAARAARTALDRLIERRRRQVREVNRRAEARERDEANLARWARLVQEGREAPP